MAITYGFDANGGFFARDAEAKILEYAYPTSPHATAAKKNPEKIATQMVEAWRGRIAHYLTLPWYQERQAHLEARFKIEVPQ